MAGRTAIFKQASEREDENEKLVELFKNRAELKKEFAELRNEQYRLQQRIKEQQGATARITQKLEHLESLLIDPEWVHTVVVFYQLRSINRRCQGKLAKFAEQLKQQRERRQQDGELATWRDQQTSDADAVQRQVGELRVAAQTIEDRLMAERSRIESMSGLAKVFKGRSASSDLDSLNAELLTVQQEEQELLQKLEVIQGREPPDTAGLSIADKRSINFMIIAFAHQLYLQFEDDRLVSLIKESGDKSVGAINYGSKQECDMLLELIVSKSNAIDSVTDFADALKRRAAMIAEHAVFKKDGDVVPLPGTVSTIFSFNSNGVVKEKDANLVGDNYWGLANVLSR